MTRCFRSGPTAALSLAGILLSGTATRVCAQPAASPIAANADVGGAKRLFSAWMDGQLAYRGLPGVVVGVVADQQLVWAQGFGLADVENNVPMSPDTKFRMASHSKLFTATSIMQLRERNKLRLDDRVVQYLPWFKVKPAGEDDGPITIEQLLTHASGLPREAGDHWTTNEFPTADQLRALMPEREAPYAPQERWKYSNLGFTVAGMVVEAVSEERWADYVQHHIFDPLAMSSSSVDVDVPGLATGYGRRMPDGSRLRFPFVDAHGMAAATGITSTVGDMAKFVSAQFRRGPMGGAQILSTASLREMHRVRSLENSWSSGTAIGFAVTRVGDKTYVGHSGVYPGHMTQTLIDLDAKVGVIVLTNAQDSDPAGIAQQLMNSVGTAVAKASSVKPTVVAWDPQWERFAGLYRSRGGDWQVIVLDQRLVMLVPNSPTLDGPNPLEPIGGGRFRYGSRSGGGSVGEVVRFVEQGGRVVRIYIGDSYFERVLALR
ncbi:MAG: beta-lactamase family protein [Polaromonas sp.]|nr:beta-lactamase family protein [Gemmatimonadaceae bacterium]